MMGNTKKIQSSLNKYWSSALCKQSTELSILDVTHSTEMNVDNYVGFFYSSIKYLCRSYMYMCVLILEA